MGFLVNPQQTGFIQGRHITDNVLNLKLGQEWADWTDQQALFFKLDFTKAYDRVDHAFMWQFMRLLRLAEHEGRLKVLEIEPGRSLLHQLFADDTGICLCDQKENFDELMRILARYELASGVQISIRKSLVMPLGRGDVPDWVYQLGCEVVHMTQWFKYLGVRTGVAISRNANIDEAVRRLNCKLLQWENFYLPWTARLVLIKHVLGQIPSYILLTVGCDKKAASRLEQTCRRFLWGVNAEGKLKKALIAWDRLVQPKSQGGLGLLTFASRAQALQMRYLTVILDNKQSEWAMIFRRMVRIKLITGPSKLDR
ncbi:hypothetical protein R1sor_013602 [Riccia sorocarpa]|uniref:Reverse transcriptase domain-containing protein n=1 Tax=Riccia sorocarpa TaxID=122646 RepID=A0ABD3H7M2_9MARC